MTIQIWRQQLSFIIVYFVKQVMGNKLPSCCNSGWDMHLEQLVAVTRRDYRCSSKLSFDPFGNDCCATVHAGLSMPQNNSSDPESSKIVEEGQETTTGQRGSALGQAEVVFEGVEVEQGVQQKNQIPTYKILKIKTIKKEKKTKKPRARPIEVEDTPLNPEEVTGEHSTNVVDDCGIRDQNNCKSYHKLVKNYLLEKGLEHLFGEYQVGYHPRYYFVVALIFIKYYLGQDFTQVYEMLVSKELEAQKRKIVRKENERKKIEAQILRTRETANNYRDLILKRNEIEMKISHIKVVIHEIEDFSVRSCRAFFSGNTEESLRILYLKDDPVMRKKYYFDSALELVAKIQTQVRKATSQTS